MFGSRVCRQPVTPFRFRQTVGEGKVVDLPTALTVHLEGLFLLSRRSNVEMRTSWCPVIPQAAQRSIGLAFDEGRHSWDSEGDDSMFGSVDEALRDQVCANRAETCRTASQARCYFPG